MCLLPISYNDDPCLSETFSMYPEFWDEGCQLPSREIANQVYGKVFHSTDKTRAVWKQIVDIVYSNKEKLEEQRLIIEKDYLI